MNCNGVQCKKKWCVGRYACWVLWVMRFYVCICFCIWLCIILMEILDGLVPSRLWVCVNCNGVQCIRNGVREDTRVGYCVMRIYVCICFCIWLCIILWEILDGLVLSRLWERVNCNGVQCRRNGVWEDTRVGYCEWCDSTFVYVFVYDYALSWWKFSMVLCQVDCGCVWTVMVFNV